VKRVLIFVSIPTHFREMIRVARLLRDSRRYEPIVFMSCQYRGWAEDEALCCAEGIEVRHSFEAPAALATGGAGPATGPTHRLPRVIGDPVRRVWRAIYANYWQLRLRHAHVIYSILIGTPVLFSAVLDSVLRRPLPPRGSRSRASEFGIRMSAAFGRLWERDSKLLPRSIRERHALYRRLPDYFRSERIRLLVLPEDNYFLETHYLVRAAGAVGAKSVVVPFTVANSLEWVQTFHGRREHSATWAPNRVFASAFPHWTYEYKGERMIMPPLQILMNEYLELTPPNPWLINSGYTDVLAAESPFMVRYYRDAGIEADKIALTGALSDDALFESLAHARAGKEALCRQLGLPAQRPMMLFTIPPDQLIGDGRPQCEFGSYAVLLKAVLTALCRPPGWNVVVALHPRMDPKHRPLIESFPAKIASDNIAQLIPLCDVFVASASATIRLAAGAGKPTINYDVYRYEYTDFLEVPGVVTVSDLAAFERSVEQITRDDQYREALAAKQRDFARESALVDGRSGERMLALFDRLTARGENSKKSQDAALA